jgi:hypothetical protein
VQVSKQPTVEEEVDPKGLRGLPPFVDVVYGAVLGYGVFETAQAIQHWKSGQPGNGTPIFLLIVTSVYLLFDYAQGRMFTEKHQYLGLTRFTLDMAIAVTFTFAYIAAARASPLYLLALSGILFLGAWWVWACKSEYPQVLPHIRFISTSHVVPLGVLFFIWLLRFVHNEKFATFWKSWVNLIVCLLYLLYCCILTIIAEESSFLSDIERSLLPIIPLYAPWGHIKRRFERAFAPSEPPSEPIE